LARDQLVGVMTLVHSTPGALGAAEFELMQAVADQAGVAVLNALLYNRLQSAHQRYRELFEDSIDPIFITDWGGRIVEANRQAALITGREADDLHQMTIDELHDPRPDKTGEGYSSCARRPAPMSPTSIVPTGGACPWKSMPAG
jgi:GAF domain-containing protein